MIRSLNRRQALSWIAAATAAMTARVHAQADRTIRFILPNATGSGVDAITRSAAPFLNSVAASWLMACRDVRSLMPISTLPLPIGITSPPSSVAMPWSCKGSPHQTLTLPAKSGWNL